MNICRLCLKDFEETRIFNPEEIIKTLHKIFPYMNRRLVSMTTLAMCEICSDNIKAAEKFRDNVTQTDSKIKKELKRLRVAKINLQGFYGNINMSSCVSICRLCLIPTDQPKVFLYENSTNILCYDYISSMLNFCDIYINLKVSTRPVMCLKCWKALQILYSFKKDYLEVEKKIKEYCLEFKFRNKNMSKELLRRVRDYFSCDYCEIITSNLKKRNIFQISSVGIKHENFYEEPKEIPVPMKTELRYVRSNQFDGTHVPPKKIVFTRSDNMLLTEIYYDITNNEQDFEGYWKKLADKWAELKPEREIPVARLDRQIERVFSERLLTRQEIDKVNSQVKLKKIMERPSNEMPGIEPESDSDDSFREVAPSSFTPRIKLEPLTDSDIEINYFTEPKLEEEIESDSEIPQLERMDSPVKVEDIYALDLKREAYDDYMRQDENIVKTIKDVESWRDGNNVYNCPVCSYYTKSKGCACKHSLLHRKRRKILQCPHCPYRNISKCAFAIHERKHRKDDEIPVLELSVLPPIY